MDGAVSGMQKLEYICGRDRESKPDKTSGGNRKKKSRTCSTFRDFPGWRRPYPYRYQRTGSGSWRRDRARLDDAGRWWSGYRKIHAPFAGVQKSGRSSIRSLYLRWGIIKTDQTAGTENRCVWRPAAAAVWDQSGHDPPGDWKRKTNSSCDRLDTDYVQRRGVLCSWKCVAGKRIHRGAAADSKRTWGFHIYRWSCDKGWKCSRAESAGTHGRYSALFWGRSPCILPDSAWSKESFWIYQWDRCLWDAWRGAGGSGKSFGVYAGGKTRGSIRFRSSLLHGGNQTDPDRNPGTCMCQQLRHAEKNGSRYGL